MLTRRKTLLGLGGVELAALPRAASAQQSHSVRLVVPVVEVRKDAGRFQRAATRTRERPLSCR